MNTVISPPAKKSDPQALYQQVKVTAAKPRERAESMPSGIYTDKDFMDFETREIFRKEWISLCHVSQVAKAGDFVRADVGGEPMLVVRGKDDEIRVV